jgi:hypothetical protein
VSAEQKPTLTGEEVAVAVERANRLAVECDKGPPSISAKDCGASRLAADLRAILSALSEAQAQVVSLTERLDSHLADLDRWSVTNFKESDGKPHDDMPSRWFGRGQAFADAAGHLRQALSATSPPTPEPSHDCADPDTDMCAKCDCWKLTRAMCS